MNARDIARRVALRGSEVIGTLESRLRGGSEYRRRVKAEKSFFDEAEDANALPPIYHYWSNTYLRPKLEQLGYSHPEALFAGYLQKAYLASSAAAKRFVSIGSGACETEIRLAQSLIDSGHDNFVIDCLDFNESELRRGMEFARVAGIEKHIAAMHADFNTWIPRSQYDGVVANSSLHHVLELEHLLGSIKQCLAPTGFFVTSDMTGRNGHMRWPEALEIVDEFWKELPQTHTYNHPLRRSEARYENWDCSGDGFEGIRAQDILRLLVDNFSFDCFLPFANIIDPFIERTFGPNFDVHNPWDIDFIDRVHRRDEAEIKRGAIKPTHLVAAMCIRPASQIFVDSLSPEFCIRSPSKAPEPHGPLILDETGCERLAAKRQTQIQAKAEAGTASTGHLPPIVNYTDLWWNPDEPGWGLSIHHHATGNVFGTFITYGADDAATWYSLQPGRWTSGTTYTGPIFKTTGPHFQRPYSAREVAVNRVGQGALSFDDEDTGLFSYEIEGHKAEKPITRMKF